jgi:hypothetical protein
MPATDQQLNELAAEVRDQILSDVTNRKGWRQDWDQFDADVRREIRQHWHKMIFNRLRDFRDGTQ